MSNVDPTNPAYIPPTQTTNAGYIPPTQATISDEGSKSGSDYIYDANGVKQTRTDSMISGPKEELQKEVEEELHHKRRVT